MTNRTPRTLTLLLLTAGCAPLPPPAAPRPGAGAGAVRSLSREVASGVRYRYLWNAEGPWAIHLVEVSPDACGTEWRAAKAGGRLVGRETTSEIAREAEVEAHRPVLASVNGDFFRFSPPGVPVGAQVEDGRIVHGPVNRPVLGFDAAGEPFISVITLRVKVQDTRGGTALLAEVNARPAGDTLALYNHFVGASTPVDTGAVEVRLRLLSGAGDRVGTASGVVTVVDTAAAGVSLGDGAIVVAGRGRGGAFLRKASPGDTLRWEMHLAGVDGAVREVIGGNPRLLRAGAVAPEIETMPASFGPARHPRTAVGWRADGTILLVTVDGRQPGYSAGMSLPELAALFQRLGAVEAVNLDGGGSTTLVVRDSVANSPSDKGGERAVANALLLFGPRAGKCDAGGSTSLH